jgi:hypothetical protein
MRHPVDSMAAAWGSMRSWSSMTAATEIRRAADRVVVAEALRRSWRTTLTAEM